MDEFERLDGYVQALIDGDESAHGVLSTGEQLYVLLAANRPDLLPGYTIAEALRRLGQAWTDELVERHSR